MVGVLGNISSWASVVVASLALYFAYRSSVASRKSADAAHEQIRHRDEKESREQASQVAAWIVARLQGVHPKIYLRYVNTSGLPARPMLVRAAVDPSLKFVVPTVEPTQEVLTVEFTSLTSWAYTEGVRKRLEDHHEESENVAIASEALSPRYTNMASLEVERGGVTVEFRDTQGTTWRRTPDGLLSVFDGTFDPLDFKPQLTAEKPTKTYGTLEIGYGSHGEPWTEKPEE